MKTSNDILLPEFERLLRDGHMVEFVPQGVSMRPFIEGGRDRVILKSCDEPRVGMIVLARVWQGYVLHRIYNIQEGRIILRGDGNLIGEEVCSLADIIGCVVQIKGRKGRKKCLTRAIIWRHLHSKIKNIYLKIYRKIIVTL